MEKKQLFSENAIMKNEFIKNKDFAKKHTYREKRNEEQ